MHLSYPEQYSINDGINVEDFPLKYVTVYDAIDLVMILGKGSLMAKLDVKSAFRLCPVRPHDQHLLGMHWNGKFYFDRVLPFGLRSAPYIFNCLAEILEWIARQRGVTAILHYLDDFFIAGPPTSTTCQHHLDILLALCEELQVPISPEKLEGPSTTITFLGILLDTNRQEARLPPTKLQELQVKLNEWSSRSYCTKQQLQSLIGSLSFAAKVVRPGHTFLRRMIVLSKTVRSLNHHIHLTPEFRLDLDWWRRFAADWNGTTFFLHPHWTPAPDLELYTDSAGAIGFGAYYQGRWFQGRWTTAQLPLSITYKELFPIAMACHVWGSEWQGKKIMFHCDNTGVVHCIQTGTSHCPTSRHSSDPSYSLQLRQTSWSWLSTFQVHSTQLLIVCHAFACRNSIDWHPQQTQTQHPSLSCFPPLTSELSSLPVTRSQHPEHLLCRGQGFHVLCYYVQQVGHTW